MAPPLHIGPFPLFGLSCGFLEELELPGVLFDVLPLCLELSNRFSLSPLSPLPRQLSPVRLLVISGLCLCHTLFTSFPKDIPVFKRRRTVAPLLSATCQSFAWRGLRRAASKNSIAVSSHPFFLSSSIQYPPFSFPRLAHRLRASSGQFLESSPRRIENIQVIPPRYGRRFPPPPFDAFHAAKGSEPGFRPPWQSARSIHFILRPLVLSCLITTSLLAAA